MPIHEVAFGGQPGTFGRKEDRSDIRRRALERLYVRKAAVDELIHSLETYQTAQRAIAPCIPFSEARKCS